MYDVTFKESFDNVGRWLRDLKDHANNEQLIIALVGNKSDLPKEVDSDTVEAYARKEGVKVVKETSAKDNRGVGEVFEEVAALIWEGEANNKGRERGFSRKRLENKGDKAKERKGCCK